MAWQASDGSEHNSQYDRDFHEKEILGSGDKNKNAFNDAVSAAGGKLLGAIIAPIILLVVGFKLVYAMTMQYAFYFWPIFFLALSVLVLEASVKLLFDGGAKGRIMVLGFYAVCVGCILFGKNIYYPNRIDSSPFSADYLVSDAALRSGRNGEGRELAQIASGEKVTVNGVSRDRSEFNITTKDGTTGWIPADAFPPDANMPHDSVWSIAKSVIPLFGKNEQQDFYRKSMMNYRNDRDWRNVIEAVGNTYFVSGENWSAVRLPTANVSLDQRDSGWPVLETVGGLSSKAMDMAISVNHPAAVTYRYDDKKGETELMFEYVIYAPEVTIIGLSCSDAYLYNYRDREYCSSLVLKDLDSGEIFQNYEYGGDLTYIFPPTKSRHFALEHALPSKKGKRFSVWDIPEVSIAANAPLLKDDPEVKAAIQAQERIDNFVSNGSNAITLEEVRLTQDSSLGHNKTDTFVPRGEIVTVVGETGTGSDIKVRYKDAEGWLASWKIKR